MTNKNKIVRDIIDFGYEYNLFSEKDDYSSLLKNIESKINDIEFLQDLDSVICEKINFNNKYIRKNKKLYSLINNVNVLKKIIE
jgi:phage anti-repressor protein